MSEEKGHSGSEEVSILSILQQIKDGIKDPGSLTKEDRQRCVEALKFQNQSVVQIAWLLKCSEKTVSRDIAAIRKKNAMSPSTDWAKEFVGELDQQVQAQIGRLTRIATSGDCKEEDRINADALIWKIRREHAQVMQTFGYLPLKPTELMLTQRDEERSLADGEQALSDVLRVNQENGTLTPELEAKIQHLQEKFKKAKLDNEVTRFLSQQNQLLNSEDSKNE